MRFYKRSLVSTIVNWYMSVFGFLRSDHSQFLNTSIDFLRFLRVLGLVQSTCVCVFSLSVSQRPSLHFLSFSIYQSAKWFLTIKVPLSFSLLLNTALIPLLCLLCFSLNLRKVPTMINPNITMTTITPITNTTWGLILVSTHCSFVLLPAELSYPGGQGRQLSS